MALQFLAPRPATMGTKVGAPAPMPRNARPPPPPPMGTRRPYRQTASKMLTNPTQPNRGLFDTRNWAQTNQRAIMTQVQPVTKQTLKNRSKRQRQKTNRAATPFQRAVYPSFPGGGYTITNV